MTRTSARLPAILLAALWVGAAGPAGAAAPPCAVPSRAELSRLPARGVVRGDMDGDGRRDRVWIAVVPRTRVACRYVLAADLGRRLVTAFVRQPYLEEHRGLPRLDVLARLNRGRGAQALVDFGIGAYVDLYGVYDLHGGRLVRMRMLPRAPKPEQRDAVFGAGASVAHGVSTICAAPGSGRVIVVGFGFDPKTGRMVVGRVGSLYVQAGEAYRPAGRRRLTPAQRAGVVAPARAPIFANCAVGRA